MYGDKIVVWEGIVVLKCLLAGFEGHLDLEWIWNGFGRE